MPPKGVVVAHACLSREVGNEVEQQGEAMPGRRSNAWEGEMRTGRRNCWEGRRRGRSLKEALGEGGKEEQTGEEAQGSTLGESEGGQGGGAT